MTYTDFIEYRCDRCGATVADKILHDEFHLSLAATANSLRERLVEIDARPTPATASVEWARLVDQRLTRLEDQEPTADFRPWVPDADVLKSLADLMAASLKPRGRINRQPS